ncbi:kelch repeat and BTB domain-containing protein 3-like [Teleopsis dalmanni]|uniref:kelch repeat and BTB domain-containing protein 3-like n=1 Tax=Teleopsis dalmanni TaxID=139649 RepID=UPI0018CD89CE|nr:kelch repeat and BTB domain-containing protein 3-like [Teleopsis dalmanni]
MSINEDKKWSELSKVERHEFVNNTARDCTFIVGTNEDEIKRIQCHKKVLADCSDVFNSMFNGNFLESAENCEIRLNDVQPSVFEYFVEFIYYDTLPNFNQVNDIIQLDYLSDKYMIRSLSDEYVESIKRMCFINVLSLPSSIYNLNPSSFVVVSEKLSTVLNKLRLFEMIEKYVLLNFMHDTEILSGSNKLIIQKLLSIVKLEDMTAKEFLDGPKNSSIIDVHTKLNALTKISEKIIQNQTDDYY